MVARTITLALLFVFGAFGGNQPGPLRKPVLVWHELAMWRNIRTGRFREALKHCQTMLRTQGIRREAGDQCNVLSALARNPDQSIESFRASTLPSERNDGHLFIPVTINGGSAQYMIDTGAGYSILTESEAKRLGLPVSSVAAVRVGDATGKGFALTKIAVAESLNLGDIHLQHVAFLVTGDQPKAMGELPPGQRGALGIQVLLACKTVQWDSPGTVLLGGPPRRSKARGANLYFDGNELFAAGAFRERKLDLVLDSGASWSCLFEKFAKAFPDLVGESGKPGTRRFWGAGGEAEVPATTLPEVTLRLGSFPVALRPVDIIATEPDSEHHDGRMGLDALSQASRVTIDFKAMKLTLE
jgi:clan AA aspartic protease (TIGR02281 family)